MKAGCIAFLLLYLSSIMLYGQNSNYYLNPNKKLNQYNYEYWSTNNGLPTNSLLHVHQSKSGYLWFTGYGGLIRFDGNTFTTFNKKNTPQLLSNVTGRIAEDTLGNLWITSQESGLISISEGKFKIHGQEEGIKDLSRAILIDKSNTLWAASPDKGWFSYKNGKFNYIEYNTPLNTIEVRSICEGKPGEIFFGTLGSGLFHYKDGKLNQINYSKDVSNLWIYSLYFDNSNTLWVGTSNGLNKFENNQFINCNLIKNTAINAISEDVNKNMWLGTKDGLYRIERKSNKVDFIGDKGLQHSFINDMTFDKEGNLWLTSYKGGVTMIKDGIFTNYSQKDGLNGKVTNAICEIDSNTFLIGFDQGRMNLLENEIIKDFITKNNMQDKRVRHIMKDSKKNIWISTYEGLLKIAPDGTEKIFSFTDEFKESKYRITFEDNLGNIWVGTRNTGVIKISPNGTFKTINEKKGLNSMLVMSINQGIDKKIYIGTNDGGVNVIENDSVVNIFNIDDGLPTNIVFSTMHDTEGYMWIAMNGCLACIRNNEINFITEKDGLVDDSPYAVIEDEFGNLWMPCLLGIMKINKAEILQHFDTPTSNIQCRLFNNNDGMFQEECNATAQSIKAKDGTLLFSTVDGVARINPKLNLKNTVVPNIKIEKIKVNGESIQNKENIQVKPGKNRLTFEFTSLSLLEPKKNQFKYKLEGYDDNWISNDGERTVSFTNLSPGYYKFQVIGSNNDDVWNTEGDSLAFYIKPLFIQTRFFYALLFVFVFITIYVFYTLRISQFKRQQRLLEENVNFRTREIMQKNQELEEQKQEILSQSEKLSEQKQTLEAVVSAKNKMFSIIAHDLRSPMGNFKVMLERLVNAPDDFSDEKRNKLLEILAENAKNTFTLLENLLNWSKAQMGIISYNPKNIELYALITDALVLIKPFAQKKRIIINLNFEQNLQVYADKDMLSTIFRNLLMNAIKFTNKSGVIEIAAIKNNNFIEVSISDNGIGMDETIQKELFNNQTSYSSLGTNNEQGSGLGLLLCKEFVEQHGGKIWMKSEFNKGTTFYFTLESPKF
jgi:signal transduction histidine kinase/ligand-binding sensor domain-containing protein